MDPFQQHTLPTTEPTQPTEETFICSCQYSSSSPCQQHMLPVCDEYVIEEYYSSSALETPRWLSLSTYQDPSEETPRSAKVPSAHSYPDSSSQILAESSQTDESLSMCLYPECSSKPFKRNADLQRHYKNAHSPDSTKEAHYCDYPKCTRASEPYRRRDHFRDHLREYHREDIQKRGIMVNEEWLEDRYYSDKWSRCPRCLVRVYISKDEFECPKCKGSCEPKRKEKRRGH